MSRITLIRRVLEGKVLDIGYAVGPLHDVVAAERDVVAIDIVVKSPQRRVVKADATCMPFNDNVFDSVLAGEVLEHVPDISPFLSECHRVLKTDGVLVITTPNRRSLINRLFHAYEKPAHLTLLDKYQLISALKCHGFRLDRYTLFPYTQESSEGSRYGWFYTVRKIIHPFLPSALQEEMVAVARRL